MKHFIVDIDPTWTLFLDRDGVLNHEKNQDYIRRVDEFIFYEGIPASIAKLSRIFNLIIIVTNQRGIGRGLMTHQDLNEIHEYMIAQIQSQNGRIDRIYYAPDLDSDSTDRKPNTGMGLAAKADFPSIDFTKSVMVGNNLSDMKFGKNLNMKTVFVETTQSLEDHHSLVDLKVANLNTFADLF